MYIRVHNVYILEEQTNASYKLQVKKKKGKIAGKTLRLGRSDVELAGWMFKYKNGDEKATTKAAHDPYLPVTVLIIRPRTQARNPSYVSSFVFPLHIYKFFFFLFHFSFIPFFFQNGLVVTIRGALASFDITITPAECATPYQRDLMHKHRERYGTP